MDRRRSPRSRWWALITNSQTDAGPAAKRARACPSASACPRSSFRASPSAAPSGSERRAQSSMSKELNIVFDDEGVYDALESEAARRGVAVGLIVAMLVEKW